MKSFSVIAVLCTVLFSSVASAQGKIWITLPQELTQCIAACQKGLVECAPDEAAAQAVETMCTSKKANAAVASLKVQGQLRRRIRKINKRLAKLDKFHRGAYDALNLHHAQIKEMRSDLETLTAQLEEIGVEDGLFFSFWRFMVRFVIPPVLLVVLIMGIAE